MLALSKFSRMQAKENHEWTRIMLKAEITKTECRGDIGHMGYKSCMGCQSSLEAPLVSAGQRAAFGLAFGDELAMIAGRFR
jgi:hypothetical protein